VDERRSARALLGAYRNTKTLRYLRGSMKLVVFETVSDQARGLQYMEKIDPETIFMFPNIREGRTFHTRNVSSPIDIAFLDQGSKVIDVVEAPPGTQGIIAPKGTAAALEAVSGFMSRIGISLGYDFQK
jgi:uncharacterized membrane protein (UPF0127 family)